MQNELFPSLDRPNPRRKPQHKACTNTHTHTPTHPVAVILPSKLSVRPESQSQRDSEAEVGPALSSFQPGVPCQAAVVLSYTHNGWSNVVTSIYLSSTPSPSPSRQYFLCGDGWHGTIFMKTLLLDNNERDSRDDK